MNERDELLEEIGALLAVTPSRGFGDGVRRRIRRRRHVTRAAMSGLALAASLLLVLVVRRPDPAPPVAMTATVPVAAVPTVAASDVAAPNVVAPTTVSTVERRNPVPRPRRVNVVTPAAEPDRYRVVTNQMAVLQELWAVPDALPVEAVAAVEMAISPLQPIEIAPIEVALLPDPGTVGARDPKPGWPVIRRAVQSGEHK
jgi:hypothetical protein